MWSPHKDWKYPVSIAVHGHLESLLGVSARTLLGNVSLYHHAHKANKLS